MDLNAKESDKNDTANKNDVKRIIDVFIDKSLHHLKILKLSDGGGVNIFLVYINK